MLLAAHPETGATFDKVAVFNDSKQTYSFFAVAMVRVTKKLISSNSKAR
jgi:hypothetical protein